MKKQLPLCPLMGGRLTQKERILTAFALTRSAQGKHTKEEIRKIEAVIYAMADKFLEAADMEEVKEAVRMTRLGQMLVAEGMEKGIEQGMEKGKEENKLANARNLLDILSEEVIAERIGLPLEKVKELKKQQNL